MKGFKNSWIITEEGRVKADLVIESGLIKTIGETSTAELVELPENLTIIPGFIDQHIHGAAGSDGMDGTIDDLKKRLAQFAEEADKAGIDISFLDEALYIERP